MNGNRTFTILTCTVWLGFMWLAPFGWSQSAAQSEAHAAGVVASKRNKLSSHILSASKSERFVASTAYEVATVERLFRRTLRTAHDGSESIENLNSAWQQVEMQIDESTLPNHQRIWILCENDDAQRGRGFYAFRVTQSQDNAEKNESVLPVALQSPHCFFDKYTRSINVRLFETGHFSAAAWNTVRRQQVDLAHTQRHYLNAFTMAFADSDRQSRIVQLHGFSQDARTSDDGRQSDLIISDGTRSPGSNTRLFAARMQASMSGFAVKLFPEDVQELGATTNSQAKALRSVGFSTFLHLEMSLAFRRAFRRHRQTRDEFIQVLMSICRS